jgi:hypothetical protein
MADTSESGGVIVRPGNIPSHDTTPPGRVVVYEGGQVFQQHWVPGMRGRIYRDLHHPERVGREVVAVARSDNEFGPCIEIDGTVTGYWWGEVEVIDPIPPEATTYLAGRRGRSDA